MSTASAGAIPDFPADKRAFLQQLPQRMAAIEENWSELVNQGWSADHLEKLYGRVREISESSARFGFYQLNENVFSAEVYLSSFVGMDVAPPREQLETIEGLLRNLRAAAASCVEGEGAEAGQGQTIYLLGRATSDNLSGLVQAFSAQGKTVRTFDETGELLRAMKEELPVAIVANTSALPGISGLSAELARLRQQMSTTIPLVFVSSSSNLQLRVEAIRAGGDAYFVSPFDDAEIAHHVLQMSASHADKPFTIMVVEDDPTQAEFAASILRKANMEVVTVTEPMRVLDTLRQTTPDLILMDIYMPEVNGIELTTVIREYNEFVGIPIVFLSGEQDTDKQIDALSVGGDDFVAKPIRPRHLLAVVENRVRRSRMMLNALGANQPHDRVTGLLSRQQFVQQVAKALEAPAGNRQAAAVLALAPDNSEALKGTLGVGGLDHLVAELAQVVRVVLEAQDASAKLGDRTLGVLVRRTDHDAIATLCTRLHEAVAQHGFGAAGTALHITASIGLCRFDEKLTDPNSLLRRAESALEKTQEGAANQTCSYAEALGIAQGDQEDDVTLTIRNCLENDTFLVRYQPLLDLQTRGSESYEISLRMPTPAGDLLGEREIRTPAEHAGLAVDIDRWLLKRAISILKRQRENGHKTQLFVRQSQTSLLDPDHPAWLTAYLRAQRMVGTGLVLDFRLADLSQDIKHAQQHIAALHALDIEVCLSRFPEKPAAFKVLRFVRANYISVAPRLLKAAQDVITDVIQQSHKAGAKVIVSNIDDPRSIDLHWSSGADFLQGNFIQRPLDNMDYDFSQVVI